MIFYNKIAGSKKICYSSL